MKLIDTSLIHQVAPFDESQKGLRPTLILLHGRGANEEDLLGLVPHLRPQLFCIAARAPFSFPYGGYTWYDLQEVGTPDAAQFSESYDRLTRFLDDVQTKYPVDPRRTFLLGFSMGTVMSYALALTKPDRIKAVVAHSGYIPENTHLNFQWENLANTSFFVAHGVYDPVIPIAFGRRANQLLSKATAPLIYREYPIQHQISEESLHDFGSWLGQQLDSSL
ncbi:MAG TPA: alpha/beta fold hydrolase [Bacteroidota bacterium]